jgi:hypothetical protein
MSIYKDFVNCLLIIAKSNNVFIVNDMITLTKFVDMNDDVSFVLSHIMIQRARY